LKKVGREEEGALGGGVQGSCEIGKVLRDGMGMGLREKRAV